MKKILAILACLTAVAGLHGLTNAALIDFSVTGDKAALQSADESAKSDAREGETKLVELYNANWAVIMNDSAQLIENRKLSYTSDVTSQSKGKVLGVRVHFPLAPWNSYAMVKPPFDLEFYGGNDGNKFANGKGVLKNVGTIRSISSWICGRNNIISYIVNLKNDSEVVNSYTMGYLNFAGWSQVKWENPSYLMNARDRVLRRTPLYPRSTPAVKLDSLQFYRTADTLGGDFVSYVKDVTMEYEEAIVDKDTDIDDEGVWGILRTESDRKKEMERKRLKEARELRDLEERRIGGSAAPATTPAATTPAKSTTAPAK